MKKISKIAFGTNNRLAILDRESSGIYLYDSSGQFIGEAGKNGRGPGRYLNPSSITFTGTEFAVADFTDHRVNLFAQDGTFSRSFIYGSQGFSATGISFNNSEHIFYLFGNRLHDQGPNNADYVHIYGLGGNYINSVFNLPEYWISSNFFHVDSAILPPSPHSIEYFMVAFEPILREIDPQKETVTNISLDLPFYASPKRMLSSSLKQINTIESWQLEFTPIRAVVPLGENLLIEYETHRGLRYTLAIVNTKKKKTLRYIETNYLIIGADLNGNAILINNPNYLVNDNHEILYAKFIKG